MKMGQDEKEVLKDHMIEKYNLSEFTDNLPQAGIDYVIEEFFEFTAKIKTALEIFNPDPNGWVIYRDSGSIYTHYDLSNGARHYGTISICYDDGVVPKFKKYYLTVKFSFLNKIPKIIKYDDVLIKKSYEDMEKELCELVEKYFSIKIDRNLIKRDFDTY